MRTLTPEEKQNLMEDMRLYDELLSSRAGTDLASVYASIQDKGFCENTIQLITNYTNDILNGKTNLTQFNQAEHAGLCCAGEMLIGAYIVCDYARASLTTGADASAGQKCSLKYIGKSNGICWLTKITASEMPIKITKNISKIILVSMLNVVHHSIIALYYSAQASLA